MCSVAAVWWCGFLGRGHSWQLRPPNGFLCNRRQARLYTDAAPARDRRRASLSSFGSPRTERGRRRRRRRLARAQPSLFLACRGCPAAGPSTEGPPPICETSLALSIRPPEEGIPADDGPSWKRSRLGATSSSTRRRTELWRARLREVRRTPTMSMRLPRHPAPRSYHQPSFVGTNPMNKVVDGRDAHPHA